MPIDDSQERQKVAEQVKLEQEINSLQNQISQIQNDNSHITQCITEKESAKTTLESENHSLNANLQSRKDHSHMLSQLTVETQHKVTQADLTRVHRDKDLE